MSAPPRIETETSTTELTVDLLKAYRNWIGAAVVVLVLITGALWYTGDLPSVDVPEPVQAATLALIGAGALGYLPARQALDYLYDPPKRYVVCIGASAEQAEEYPEMPPESFKAGVYQLNPAAWEQVRSIDHDLYQWDGVTWPTYEVQAFDRETLRAVGTWRGSKPDSELIRREKEIRDLRVNLEQAADTSIDTELAISSKVRQAVKTIGQAIITEHAEASTYEGEQVAEVLSDIRQDVEEDTGEDMQNGERPVQQLRSLSKLADNMEQNDE